MLHGVTLLEVLVVVAILAILLTICTPSLMSAIYMANMADCRNRLHNLYTGTAQWAAEHHDRLPVLTNGTGKDSFLSPYSRYEGKPEVAVFVENYLNGYAEELIDNTLVRMSGEQRANPLRCPVSEDIYGDAARYTSYEFLGFSRSTVDTDLTSNNGHGNNEDGVDVSNPGESKEEEDTDPLVDDENKGTLDGYGISGENLPIRTYFTKIKPRILTSDEYDLPAGRVILAMDRAVDDPNDPLNCHAEGANVLFGDGEVDFIPRAEFARPELVSKGEVLTKIGAGGTLRPNRSHGWHGSPSEASFFYPGCGPDESGPGKTKRLIEVGAPGLPNDPNRGTGRGIFY